MRHTSLRSAVPRVLALALFAAGCGGDYGDAPADEAEAEAETSADADAEASDAEPVMVATESGLRYQVLQEGDGVSPVSGQHVTVHYRGTFPDGGQFDSSYDTGEPAEFAVDGVIPGFSEALKLMKVGGRLRAHVPSELGYGEQGGGASIGPNQDLIFEIELLAVR